MGNRCVLQTTMVILLQLLMSPLFLSPTLLAQPSNDDCSTATSITDGQTPFDNFNATNSGIPVDSSQCSGTSVSNSGNDVWFSYTAPENGFLDVTTCPAGFDTDLVIYDGDCANLNQLSCNGDACFGFSSTILAQSVDPGATYLIRVGGFNGTQGSGILELTLTPANDPEDCTIVGDEDLDGLSDCEDPDCLNSPSCENDECEGATPIDKGFTNFDNTLASTGGITSILGGCDASGAFNDIWYSYIAPEDGFLEISTCPGGIAGLDTDLFLYSGSCGNLTQLACDGDACGPNSGFGSFIDKTSVFAGETYFLRLGGFNGNRGSGNLLLNYSVPGDDCFAATTASLGPNTFDTSNLSNSATSVPLPDPSICPGTNLGQASQDIWFQFTAPTSGSLQFTTCEGTNFDTDLVIYTGTCNDLTQVACNGDNPNCSLFSSEISNFPAISGTQYYIRIGSYLNGGGPGELNITYSGQTPENCNQPGDEDEDGLADCVDPDCTGTPSCLELGQCSDGIDNDLDGLIDCSDWDCDSDQACLDCPTSLSQNLDPTDVSQIVQICAYTPEHTENEILRSFDTSQYPCDNGLRVLGVNVGIGFVDYASGPGLTTAVRAYIDNNGGEPDDSMTLLEEKLFTVTSSMSGTIQGISFSQPVLIPFGAQLVIGFWVSDSGGPGSANVFRPGGNSAGETSETWLLAPECGIYYRTLSDIGLLEQPVLSVIIDDQGPGPAGDICASAIPAAQGLNPLSTSGMLDSPTPFPGTANNACSGTSIHSDRWFRFTAPHDGSLKVSTCGLVDFDAIFEIYQGSCETLLALIGSCDSSSCTGGSAASLSIPVLGGETYRIRIGSSQPGISGNGNFELTWTPPLPIITEVRAQSNGSSSDDFIEIKGLPQDLTNLSIVTIGSDPINGSGVIRSVIPLNTNSITPVNYFIIAEEGFTQGSADKEVPTGTLGLEDDTNLTVLLVKDLSVPVNSDLDTDDDGTIDLVAWAEILDGVSLVSNPLDPLTQQPTNGPKIYSDSTVGPTNSEMPRHVERCPETLESFFSLGLEDPSLGGDSPRQSNLCLGPPPNDVCSSAISISTGIHLLDTASSTSGQEPWDPNCEEGIGGDMRDDVWFIYSSNSYGHLSLSTCDVAGWDSDLAIYTPDCLSPLQLACNGDAPGSINGLGGVCQPFFSRIDQFPVAAGDSYLIRVGGWESGEQGIATLTLSQEIQGDTNCDPINVSPGSTILNLEEYSLTEGALVNPSCINGAPIQKDIWCRILPVAECTLELSTCTQDGSDPLIEVYEGECDSMNLSTPLACSDTDPTSSSCSPEDSALSLSVQGGTPLLIRVSLRGDQGLSTQLNLECIPTNPVTLPQANFTQQMNGAVQVMNAEVTLNDLSDVGSDPFATLEIDWGDGTLQSGLIPGSSYTHYYEIDPNLIQTENYTPSMIVTNLLGTSSIMGESLQLVPIGDANLDGALNVADVITILGYLFSGTADLNCPRAADLNADSNIDIADAIYTLNYIFVGGSAPAPVVNSSCELL